MLPLRLLVASLALAALAVQRGDAQPAKKPRQVYVLHSGVHTIFSHPRPNRVTEEIQELLIKHGVPESDIIQLDNPFPVASAKNPFPKETLGIFLASIDPASKTAQEAYVRLDKVLAERAVGCCDRLVWIGHSAGGPVGLAMIHLGKNIDRYPELAKRANGREFDMVITLGSPLSSEMASCDVPLRHYYSPRDRVVRWAALYGTFALFCMGHKIDLLELPACNANTFVRVFQGIEHPYWDEERVVLRILAETRADHPPLWQRSAAPTMGAGLSQLLCRALADQFHVTMEDPPE